MSNTDIVVVNVTQTLAPAPNTLQRTGALISQGGTTLAANATKLLTQLSDLTGVLSAAKTLASLAWSGSVVTGTTTAPHNWPLAETFLGTIAGATPAGYNGQFPITPTGATTFTYPLVSNPGAETIPGTVISADESQLLGMATTFFANGSGVGVYVLELGEGDVAHGITALAAYIAANAGAPNNGGDVMGQAYRYLVPREWDNQSAFMGFLPNYNATTAKVYFHTTTTLANYPNYSPSWKCGMLWIEAAGIPATEFSAAADFQVALNYAPSPTNKVPPNSFAFLNGVTPYPTVGNSATRSALKTAKVNIVGTGAEGGISKNIALYGTMLDGHDLTYWYSVDWVQINVQLDLAAAIIDGSNDPINPLYYDQPGINRLQAVAQRTMNSGTSDGLVLGTAQVTAIPFGAYVAANPNDYAVGSYNGLAVTYTPNRGFKQITFNVDVTDIPTP